MSNKPNGYLQAALLYSLKGWRVIPVSSPRYGNGKKPILNDWPKAATTDQEKIKSWWSRWPDANVGIATGRASKLIALDVDPAHGGDESLFALETQYGKLPQTIVSHTGGGGRHLLFEYTGEPINNSASALGAGLDIRADGGQIVVPPSLHKSGRVYEWEATSNPDDTPLAKMPDWFLNLLTTRKNGGQPKQGVTTRRIKAGARNNTLASMAGKMRRNGFDTTAIEAALLVENKTHCNPPLAEDEVKRIAHSIGRYPTTRETVPTDDELADQWLEKCPDTAYGLGEFRRYHAGCWWTIPNEIIEGEVLGVMEAAKLDGCKPSHPKLRSIVELARIKVIITNDRWNNNHDVLVCKNGTLHIPSKILKTHSKDDYMTSGLPYDYDPKAIAPTWAYFLKSSIPQAGGFLQEFAGYCLTIDTRYELAVWLYGAAGTGKSTFITGLQAMLGNKAGVLGLADIERSRFALSDLPDKTLLVSSEQPATYITASNIINSLISGEPVMIDRKYKDPITLNPRAKVLWAMNELPRIPEAGNGLFRRVKVVHFPPLKGKPDPEVKEAIRGEGAGILNWALVGLVRLLQRKGFDVPQCVQDATEQFRESNDIPAAFVADMCEVGEMFSVQSNNLYTAYHDWCIANGHKPQSNITLAEDWRRLGFEKKKRSDGNYWEGLRLKV